MNLDKYKIAEICRKLNKVFQDRNRKLGDIPSNVSLGAADCPYGALSLGDNDVLDMICGGKLSLEQLKIIKHVGKELVVKNASAESGIFGKVLYNAAIASSLVHRNHKISNLEPEFIINNLEILCLQDWLSKDMQALFTKAIEICRRDRTRAA